MGRGFESLQAHQRHCIKTMQCLFLCLKRKRFEPERATSVKKKLQWSFFRELTELACKRSLIREADGESLQAHQRHCIKTMQCLFLCLKRKRFEPERATSVKNKGAIKAPCHLFLQPQLLSFWFVSHADLQLLLLFILVELFELSVVPNTLFICVSFI